MTKDNIDIKVGNAITDIELVSKRIDVLMNDLSNKYFSYAAAEDRIDFDIAECYYRMIEEYFYTLHERIKELENLNMQKATR